MNERLDKLVEEAQNHVKQCMCGEYDTAMFTKISKDETAKNLVVDLKWTCVECFRQFTLKIVEPKE